MTSPALAPLVADLPDGVMRLELDTPFPVGAVNSYLLVDHPITIVDPGMLWADTGRRIETFLSDAGLALADIEQVVVTHGHPDHFGAAGWVAEQANAPILCGRAEEPKLLNSYAGDLTALHRTYRFFDHLGVPPEVRDQFPAFYDQVRPLIHPLQADRLQLVDDLDTLLAGGRSWDIHITPGHAVGHVSLFDADTETLIAGDHLLAHITPNPLIEPDADAALGRRRSLVEYLASLDRFEALGPQVMLPGHGPGFTDITQWSTAVRAHHDGRANEILDAIRTLGTPTTFELSQHLFPKIRGFSHMLGMSEVLGHIDLLTDEGAIATADDLPTRYATT